MVQYAGMNKRYWLKGGVVGSIVGILIILLIQLTAHQSGYDIQFQGKYLVSLLTVALGGPIIGGFVIGSIAGWLYGKIKNRNKV